MTATAIVIKNGKLLVVKRNMEPEFGKFDFLGGFLNKGELPEEALKREIFEETKSKIERYEFLGLFPGTHSYKDKTFSIISAAYLVHLKGDTITLDKENSDYKWVAIDKINTIAFDSNKGILKRVKELYLDIKRVKELMKQLDLTAEVSEFNLYESQLCGYLSREYDKGKLIGMGWIFPRQTALRKQAVVEDMIVDEKYRGKGLGKKIVLDLINWAKKNGIEVIELTSNPKRVAANELYKAVGFKLHPTNHYLLDLRK